MPTMSTSIHYSTVESAMRVWCWENWKQYQK